jgi:hypothetical protein
MQWSPKENQPLWPRALPMQLNLIPDQPYRLTSPCPSSSQPSLTSRMTSPTSSKSSSNKAPRSKNKTSGSRNFHPYASSSAKPNWTTESALGPYTIISFPSRKEKSQKGLDESRLDRPIEASSLKRTLFERLTVANPSPNQRTKTFGSETSSPGASTPLARPEKRSLQQRLQSSFLHQQPQQPSLLHRLQPLPLLQRLQLPFVMSRQGSDRLRYPKINLRAGLLGFNGLMVIYST